MKNDKQSIFHGQLVKTDKGILSTVGSSKVKYQDFVKNLNKHLTNQAGTDIIKGPLFTVE